MQRQMKKRKNIPFYTKKNLNKEVDQLIKHY